MMLAARMSKRVFQLNQVMVLLVLRRPGCGKTNADGLQYVYCLEMELSFRCLAPCVLRTVHGVHVRIQGCDSYMHIYIYIQRRILEKWMWLWLS
jgi:hypothetical protein